MKLILLPGMDGTGCLFKPLLNALPDHIENIVISYPNKEHLNYHELEQYVFDKLPMDDDYYVLAESFSGPIGYLLTKRNLTHMKGVFFVATFLKDPRRGLINLIHLLPLSLLPRIPLPKFVITKYLLDHNADANTISLLKETLKQVDGSILSFRLRQISRLSLNLEKIRIPSYYIQALDDKLVSPQNLDTFTEICTQLKILKLKGPHFILQTHPGDCAEFIANIMDTTINTHTL